MDKFTINIDKDPAYYVLNLIGEMDLYGKFKLKDAIKECNNDNMKNIIINFDKLSYIDSSGIGALIRINSEYLDSSKKLVFTNLHDSVEQIIKLAMLQNYFPIVKNLEEAIKEIKKN